MFSKKNYDILVTNNSFIIRNEYSGSETIISFPVFIPNVPFYYHLLDDASNYFTNIIKQVKSLKIKYATIILPDDAIDMEIDKQLLTAFFRQSGAKHILLKNHSFLLSPEYGSYISVSRTTRAVILQYISDNKSLAKRYYDIDIINPDQLISGMNRLHNDCAYGKTPVFINNMYEDMTSYESIGTMVTLYSMLNNLPKLHTV